jgi:hypothetical protein
MPHISAAELLPTGPLQWTSILHYIVIVSTLFILITSGDKASVFYILILGSLALITGADLYVDRFGIPRLFIFIFRVLILGIPLILSGISPTEQTRSLSGMTAFLASPILAVTFFTCFLGDWGDPRLVSWCR